jgi:hypothetical protein
MKYEEYSSLRSFVASLGALRFGLFLKNFLQALFNAVKVFIFSLVFYILTNTALYSNNLNF